MSRGLTPTVLLAAYSRGVFPMAHDDGRLYWYDPDPRAILPLDAFHVPRSLARTVRQGKYQILFNRDFDAVIRACAAPAPERESTWIDERIIQAYHQLNLLGVAHSVEAWRDGELVGGLYGVALGGFFAGESMFSRARDASKVALVTLVERMRRRNFALLDIQFMTAHLQQFGAINIPRAEYQARLAQALDIPTRLVGALEDTP